MNHQTLSSFIWSVADLLQGHYKQSEHGWVTLTFTVLCRLDYSPGRHHTKEAVLAEFSTNSKVRLLPQPSFSASPARPSTLARHAVTALIDPSQVPSMTLARILAQERNPL